MNFDDIVESLDHWPLCAQEMVLPEKRGSYCTVNAFDWNIDLGELGDGLGVWSCTYARV